MIGGLHHNAYRCRDSEETRAFYEDFLGLKLAHALRIGCESNIESGACLTACRTTPTTAAA